MQQTKKAFSFVEIIIVISIIALLAIVGLSYQGASNQKAKNTKAIGDIETLNNSLLSYLAENQELPTPKGNINYFGSGSEYVHDASNAFGVHGFVTQNLLPKKYLNYLPLDPRTNQYYGYGKTINNKFFEVAGVLNVNGEFTSKVKGNYPGEEGPYALIREYNGPDFVEDGSKTSFPYNPEERVLVAQIDSFSGTVTISSDNYVINDPEQVLEHTIVPGDKITVSAGGLATIFYSDGSQSTLGDSNKESKLAFAKMEFKKDDNLLTNIQLALESGTLWTKATHLNDEGSDFEVYTIDTAASVRGTIFGVTRDNTNKSKITVQEGIVEVKKIPATIDTTPINSIDDVIEAIKEEKIKQAIASATQNITIPSITETDTDGNSIIKVDNPATPKAADTTNQTSTTPEDKPEEETFSENINFEVEEVVLNNLNTNALNGNNPEISISIPLRKIQRRINSIAIVKDGTLYFTKVENPGEVLTITQAKEFTKVVDGKKINKRNALAYRKIIVEGEYPLGNIITADSEFKLYLCRYRDDLKRLKCSGKKEFKVNGDSMNYDKEAEEAEKDIEEEAKKEAEDEIAQAQEEVNENEYGELYASAEFNEAYGNGCEDCGWGGSKENFEKNYQLLDKNGTKVGNIEGNIYTFEDYSKTVQGLIPCQNGNKNYWSTISFTNPLTIPDGLSKLTYGENNNTCGHNLYSISNGNKTVTGVIISEGKYLKYTDLDLGKNFTIEMSVRGADLKRDDDDYNLFDTNTGNNGTYLKITEDKHCSNLEPNNFYKIISTIINDEEMKIKVLDKNGTDISEKCTFKYGVKENNTILYIGSRNDISSQWNGLIDYVKIYKKD